MEQLLIILIVVGLALLAVLAAVNRAVKRRQLARTRAAGNAPPYITGERGYRLHQPDPDHLREPEYHQGDGTVTSAGGLDPRGIGVHYEGWDPPPDPQDGDTWQRGSLRLTRVGGAWERDRTAD